MQHGTPGRSTDTEPAEAVRRAHRLLARLVPGADERTDQHGVGAIEIPVAMPTMSGLLLPDHAVDAAHLRSVASRFTTRGMPWSLNVIGAAPPAITELAEELGMAPTVSPTMVMPLHAHPAAGQEGGTDRVLQVSTAADRRRWTATCDRAFGLPVGTSGSLMAAAVVAAPEIRTYLVLRDGIPVATAVSTLDDLGWLGLFCVATVPEARRTGTAERLMRFAVQEGASRGAHTAFLETTPAGRPLYERIGFRDAPVPTVYFTTDGTSAPA